MKKDTDEHDNQFDSTFLASRLSDGDALFSHRHG